MTGYLEKLQAWADGTDGYYTIETTDNVLARWVTIRREDGFCSTAHGETYDEAASYAAHLLKAKRKTEQR